MLAPDGSDPTIGTWILALILVAATCVLLAFMNGA